MEYYQTPEGRIKKKIQNGRASHRQRRGRDSYRGFPPHKDSSHTKLSKKAKGLIGKTIVNYLRMVASLIEGRFISEEEILRMIVKILRQHSIGKEKGIGYFDKYP